MKKLLIELSAPGWDGAIPGKPLIESEIAAFLTLLLKHRTQRHFKVEAAWIEPGQELVNTERLAIVNQKAKVLDWLEKTPEVMLAIMNGTEVPPEVAYALGQIQGDILKRRREAKEIGK